MAPSRKRKAAPATGAAKRRQTETTASTVEDATTLTRSRPETNANKYKETNTNWNNNTREVQEINNMVSESAQLELSMFGTGPTTKNPLPAEDDASHRTDRISELSSKPSNVYVAGPVGLHTASKLVMDEFVAHELWPRVKFLEIKDEQMDFSNEPKTICYQASKACNLDPDHDNRQWWKSARSLIVKGLKRLRNDKVRALQMAFYGK